MYLYVKEPFAIISEWAGGIPTDRKVTHFMGT